MVMKTPENIESVLTEIAVLRQLNNPNVIGVHEVYESKKYIHLVLPYLEGGELFERIKSKGLYKENMGVPVMRNLLKALEYLNQMNVVHRDLKPENLILKLKDNDSELLIADFGLAAILENSEQLLARRCGSPGFIAPELLDDKGYNCMADVFSAGSIMYMMLSGRLAFRGVGVDDILRKNKDCVVEYPEQQWSKISSKAQELCSLLMKKDPAERITPTEALLHPWFDEKE